MEFAMQRLVDIQYQRNQVSRARGTFRVTGDTLEVFPPYEQAGYRIEWWGDEVQKISMFDPLTGEIVKDDIVDHTTFPASHYVASDDRMKQAIVTIEEELHERLAYLDSQGKLLEAERLRMRTTYDLEMLREMGFCSGIENYSRHIDGREAGTAPFTLLDYFPDDYLVVLDESHVTVPQLRGHVRGRRLAQDHARRLRVPPAERDRQPAVAVRGVPRACRPGRLHVGDTRAVRAPALHVDRRADRATDRPGRPRGADPPDQGPDRRPDGGDPRPGRVRPARPRHHPHQEDGRGPHRLPASRWGSASGTCTPRSTPSSGSRSSATCAWGSSTFWSASTCSGRASTCPRCRSSRSSTQTRRGSCGRKPPSYRRSGGRPATSTAPC